LASLRSALVTFRDLDWSRRGLFLEAALTVTLVAFAIRLLPFRVLMRLAEWPLGVERAAATRPQVLRRVRWAVLVAGRRTPWDAVCLHQSLTAQILLRRRGVPSTLYYGANAGDAAGMKAHAWVQCGGVDVVGGENAADYAVLATFPQQNAEKLGGAPGT
jgi:hypothetical protein